MTAGMRDNGGTDPFRRVLLAGVVVTYVMFNPRPVAETMAGLDLIRAGRGAVLIAVLMLVLLGSLLNGRFQWARAAFKRPLVWYTAYVLWALLSVIYSGDRFLSLAKVFELGVAYLAVLYIFDRVNSRRRLEWIWNAMMAAIAFVAILYFAFSFFGDGPIFVMVNGFPKYQGFGGGLDGANGLTQIGSILGLFSISRLLAGRGFGRFSLLLGLSTVLMLVSYSRSSMFLFILLAIYLLAKTRSYPSLTIFALGAAAALLLLGGQLYEYLLRGQDLSMFMSLTGRTTFLWVGGLAVFLQSPWIGHGFYYATTYLLPLELFGGYSVALNNVDNTFLEVAMNIGVVGLFFFAGLWVSVLLSARKAFARLDGPWDVPLAREGAIVLLSTFARSWINPTIVYHHWNNLLFLVAVLAILRCAKINEERRNKPVAATC